MKVDIQYVTHIQRTVETTLAYTVGTTTMNSKTAAGK